MKKFATFVVITATTLLSQPFAHAKVSAGIADAMKKISGHYVLVADKSAGAQNCAPDLTIRTQISGDRLAYSIASSAGNFYDSNPMNGVKRKVVFGTNSDGAPFITLKDSSGETRSNSANDLLIIRSRTKESHDFRLVGTTERVLVVTEKASYKAIYSRDAYGSTWFPSNKSEYTCRYVEAGAKNN